MQKYMPSAGGMDTHLRPLFGVLLGIVLMGSVFSLISIAAVVDGTCNGYNLNLTFYVYAGSTGDKGKVNFAGTLYGNGGRVTVCATSGQPFSISATNIASGHIFYQWTTTTGGQFGNPYSASTSFMAPTSTTEVTGSIQLVLDGTGGFLAANLFGGYLLYSPVVPNVPHFSGVQGTFIVPGFQYVPPRESLYPENELAIGVGLGGVNGIGWWTVLLASISSSGTVTYSVQDWVVNPGHYNTLIKNQPVPAVSKGAQIVATIRLVSGSVYSSMCGFSDGCRSYAATPDSFDLSTAQWFAASLKDCVVSGKPGLWYSCHDVPNFTPIQWSTPNPGSTLYPSLITGGLLYLKGPGSSPLYGQTVLELIPGRALVPTNFFVFYLQADTTPPTAPGAPTWTAGDERDGTFAVTWSPASDSGTGVKYYELQVQESGGPWFTFSSTIGTNSYTITNAIHGRTYYFRVRAQDNVLQWGPFSATSSPATIWYRFVINSALGGTTVPSAGTYYYAPGSSALVQANPDSNQMFRSWTLDGVTRTENPISVTMSADHTLTPSFIASLSASATAYPTSVSPSLPVQFSGSASGGISPYSYSWTFGDGGTSTLKNPSHSYNALGTYTATLTVRDSASPANAVSRSLTITVENFLANISPATQTVWCDTTADFTAVVRGGSGSFSYAWTFDDGATASGAYVVHTWATGGTHTATLRVYDGLTGQTATATASVTFKFNRYC